METGSLGPFLSHGALVLAFAAGVTMLGSLLRQRRSPQSAMAWIAFAILLPYLAVPLFFLLGWRKFGTPGRVRVAGPHDSGDSLESLLASFGLPPARDGNRLRLCGSGEGAHEALVALIEGARTRLDLEIFILHLDGEGKDVLSRLERRASEGLRVRLLLDGLGSFTTWPWTLRRLERAGAEVAFFHPLFRPSWWLRANLRNHRKIVIADRKVALAGGINIADEYLGPEPGAGRWTDLAFLVEGPVVGDYQRIVDADWSYANAAAGSPSPAVIPASVARSRLQVVTSGPDETENALRAALLQAIYDARERIWIVTPYFLPDSELGLALGCAARRGIDVRVVLPRVSNHRLADWARGSYLRELKAHGARVLYFEKGMLHAKAVLVDEKVAMLGSANLDPRSLDLDFEVMLFVRDPDCVATVEGWIEGLLPWTSEQEQASGPAQEIFEGAVRLLAPLL